MTTQSVEINGTPVRYVYATEYDYYAVTGKDDFFTTTYMLTKARFDELKKLLN